MGDPSIIRRHGSEHSIPCDVRDKFWKELFVLYRHGTDGEIVTLCRRLADCWEKRYIAHAEQRAAEREMADKAPDEWRGNDAEGWGWEDHFGRQRHPGRHPENADGPKFQA